MNAHTAVLVVLLAAYSIAAGGGTTVRQDEGTGTRNQTDYQEQTVNEFAGFYDVYEIHGYNGIEGWRARKTDCRWDGYWWKENTNGKSKWEWYRDKKSPHWARLATRVLPVKEGE